MDARLAFPKENNGSLKKIAKLEDPAEYSRLGMVVSVIFKIWIPSKTLLSNTQVFSGFFAATKSWFEYEPTCK